MQISPQVEPQCRARLYQYMLPPQHQQEIQTPVFVLQVGVMFLLHQSILICTIVHNITTTTLIGDTPSGNRWQALQCISWWTHCRFNKLLWMPAITNLIRNMIRPNIVEWVWGNNTWAAQRGSSLSQVSAAVLSLSLCWYHSSMVSLLEIWIRQYTAELAVLAAMYRHMHHTDKTQHWMH